VREIVGNALTEEEARKKSVENERKSESERKRERGVDNELMEAK